VRANVTHTHRHTLPCMCRVSGRELIDIAASKSPLEKDLSSPERRGNPSPPFEIEEEWLEREPFVSLSLHVGAEWSKKKEISKAHLPMNGGPQRFHLGVNCDRMREQLSPTAGLAH